MPVEEIVEVIPPRVPTQILNALSRYVAADAAFWNVIGDLRQIRGEVNLFEIASLPADTVFPGDLGHVTVARIIALKAAMDALDIAFMTPNASGIPPVKAIVDMIP